MKYCEALWKLEWRCPFCEINDDLKIYDYASAYMTIAMAPYWADHLLIIPKRHVDSIFDLTIEEHDEMQWLIRAWIKMLRKKWHHNYSIVVREWEWVWKSVKHIHYHILPDIELKALWIDWDRKFLSNEEWKNIISELSVFKV